MPNTQTMVILAAALTRFNVSEDNASRVIQKLIEEYLEEVGSDEGVEVLDGPSGLQQASLPPHATVDDWESFILEHKNFSVDNAPLLAKDALKRCLAREAQKRGDNYYRCARCPDEGTAYLPFRPLVIARKDHVEGHTFNNTMLLCGPCNSEQGSKFAEPILLSSFPPAQHPPTETKADEKSDRLEDALVKLTDVVAMLAVNVQPATPTHMTTHSDLPDIVAAAVKAAKDDKSNPFAYMSQAVADRYAPSFLFHPASWAWECDGLPVHEKDFLMGQFDRMVYSPNLTRGGGELQDLETLKVHFKCVVNSVSLHNFPEEFMALFRNKVVFWWLKPRKLDMANEFSRLTREFPALGEFEDILRLADYNLSKASKSTQGGFQNPQRSVGSRCTIYIDGAPSI